MWRELSMHMLRSVEKFVDALGCSAAVAKIADGGASAVSNWKDNGSIPPEYFFVFAAAANARGLAFEPLEIFGFKREVA